MRPSNVTSDHKESWRRLPIASVLRRRHCRILDLRETAWFYAVGLITAGIILWQPTSAANSTTPTLHSGTETVMQSTTDREVIYDRLLPKSTPTHQAAGPVAVALHLTDDVHNNPQPVALVIRARIANPRVVGGRSSVSVRGATGVQVADEPLQPESPLADAIAESPASIGTSR